VLLKGDTVPDELACVSSGEDTVVACSACQS